jgi:hypothetical protein
MMCEGLSKRINQLPNEENGQTTSPDIPYSRNAAVSYINAGEEDQMVWFSWVELLIIS